MNAPELPAPAWKGLPWVVKANVIALGGLALLLSLLLWPSWRHDPDVSHGLFMPVLFIFLLHHGRKCGPARYLRGSWGTTAAAIALALAGLGLVFLAGLYAAALDWSNALVEFLFAAAFSLMVGGALVSFADERIRLIPFNWTTCVAAGLWPLSAPIPPGTYTRLTVGLQLWVSTGVLHALHVFGIVAIRQGNVIQLADTSVGVEEACSGVRSLVSCVFVGLVFSAALVSRPRARALIIALAAPLALGMNFIRSLTLTLLANAGISIAGAWHDATGFAVLGATAVLLGGLALFLERGVRPSFVPRGGTTEGAAHALRSGLAGQRVLAAVAALSAILALFFYANTRPAVREDAPVPDLLAILPESSAGWTVTTRTDLYQFSGVLQTDVLAQRTYRREGPEGPDVITLYMAYWRPGQASVSLVATHTPDACWPGAGWVLQPQPESRIQLSVDGRKVTDGELRLFKNSGYSRYVCFWHLYDGRPIPYLMPRSLGPLLRIAWRYGFRHNGSQVFLRISSNRPWSEIAGEPLLQDFFRRAQPLGL